MSNINLQKEYIQTNDNITNKNTDNLFQDNNSKLHGKRRPKSVSGRDRKTRSLYGASQNVNFGPKACIVNSQSAVVTIQDPSSQRLNWSTPPCNILVILKIYDPTIIQPFIDLTSWLIDVKHMTVHVEKNLLEDANFKEHDRYTEVMEKLKTFNEEKVNLTNKIDFVICLGGDGTLLYVSSLFQESVPPVMAFHLGSLGFLTPFDFSEYQKSVTAVLEEKVSLTLRTRLKCIVCKSGTNDAECSSSKEFKTTNSKQNILVLNEVVLDRGSSSYLSNIDLYIENNLVTSVQGDGIIIATPTGSTAYAAAAGASMVHPNIPAILITPICPHSLSFRPIIVPAGVEIRLMVSDQARNSAWVSFDGRNRQEILVGDSVRVTTSIYPVPSICSSDQISDWFNSLAGCLHWNVRKPQSSLTAVSYESINT